MSEGRLLKTQEILVVEDSGSDSKMILRALGKSPRKKHIVSVKGGDEALHYLRRAGAHALPDLILLDLNLPGKDGWEVLGECKTDNLLKGIPIVVFTTSQLDAEVRRCYEMGANSIVGKPFEFDHFIDTVQGIENYWLGISSPAN